MVRRPNRSDSVPAIREATPHITAWIENRLATTGTLLARSVAMAVRNGAMPDPVEVTAKVAAASATSIATVRVSVTASRAQTLLERRACKLTSRPRLRIAHRHALAHVCGMPYCGNGSACATIWSVV